MTTPWWHGAVLYQVYPRSFQDSDGDGVGDLRGIAVRLPALAELGVDAVWISPIFPSPMADFGYDVADYCGVDPRFGTLADFDALLARAHQLGLKVLLDFVPNHSSDQHPWFQESRASRDNPRRDWYIWRDPAPGGGPPNNWISDFGGPAWEYDAATGQYYSHAFLKEQPDLNWRNPDLRAAMMDVLRFWFDRGVDGFRIDVLWHMVKHPDFPDNPANPDYREGMGEMWRVLQLHSTDQPDVHDVAAEMRAIADGYGEKLLIGEIYLPVERLMRYYGSADSPGVHLPFNFQLIDAPWNARALATLIEAYELALPGDGWPNWVLGNHDRPRAATRFGAAQARVAAMLLLTLRGTPTIYYGDELGMVDVTIPPDRVTDPRELREPGLGLGRDPVRTPMAWDDTSQAGFSTAEPWLPLHADWQTRNVAAQRAENGSMWRLHRELLGLRRATPALATGDWHPVHADDAVLAYERRQGEQRVLMALNLTSSAARFELPDWARLLTPRLGTLATLSAPDDTELTLMPDEGLILT
ncbi:alpha-amylase family glycosyl hydrolase [Sphingomonas sp.]|uniref:alpha-amylase family glycosyl hydrolase n=1 Tax=Sphingomonas sp. TaxID=28214 RepID=UPI002C21D42A|nr:alpha-amylase family glycosyl hydrolase [Sphingomonas sp.]HTG38236.1 alpha-amylase family glycosyl hydrolase [Sphingomonas sp.]